MTSLPAGWVNVALGDLGTWYGGGTPSKARSDFWSDGTVPWLSPKDMGPEVLRSTQDHITESAVGGSAVRRVRGGSVALVVRSGILERTLPIAVVPMEVTLNQDMKALVPRPGVDARWVAWGLRSREQALLRECRKAGTTVASIDTKRLLAQELPVPELDEQLRIVEILEDHLSRLDAALGDVSAAAARLGALRGRILDRALDEAEAVGSPVSLGSLVRPGRKLAYGVLVPGPHVEEGVPLIRVGDLRGGVVRQSELKRIAPEIAGKFPRTLLQGGEVLLSLVGTIGRTGVAPLELAMANVARAVGVLPLRDGVEARFVSLLLEGPRSNRALNGLAHEVARKTLNLEDVKRFVLPMPSPMEQDRIVASADEALSAVQRMEAASATTRSRSGALRRSILAAAFSGRLTT